MYFVVKLLHSSPLFSCSLCFLTLYSKTSNFSLCSFNLLLSSLNIFKVMRRKTFYSNCIHRLKYSFLKFYGNYPQRGSKTPSFAHVEYFTFHRYNLYYISSYFWQNNEFLEGSDNILFKFCKTPRATRHGKSYYGICIILEVNKYVEQLRNE